MGTAWYIASSTVAAQGVAARAIIAAALSIVGIILVYRFARKNPILAVVLYCLVVFIILFTSVILIISAAQNIVSTAGVQI